MKTQKVRAYVRNQNNEEGQAGVDIVAIVMVLTAIVALIVIFWKIAVVGSLVGALVYGIRAQA